MTDFGPTSRRRGSDQAKWPPERAVRLLRAKAAELENLFLPDDKVIAPFHIAHITADIAIIAHLLADFMEHSMGNLTQEMLESRRPYVTKTGKVLTDAQIEAWADEAERGYDITHMTDRQPQQQGDTP